MSLSGMMRKFRRKGPGTELKLTRYGAGDYRDGVFQRGPAKVSTIDGSIQAITEQTPNVTTEMLQSRQSYMVLYTTQKMQVNDEKLKTVADIIECEGQRYMVMGCYNFQYLSLMHYQAFLKRETR